MNESAEKCGTLCLGGNGKCAARIVLLLLGGFEVTKEEELRGEGSDRRMSLLPDSGGSPESNCRIVQLVEVVVGGEGVGELGM